MTSADFLNLKNTFPDENKINHKIKNGTNPKIIGLVNAARPKRSPERNLFFRLEKL